MKVALTGFRESVRPWLYQHPIALYAYRRLRLLRSVPLGDLAHPRKLSLLLRVAPYSLMSYASLAKIYDITEQIRAENLHGAWVECGTWSGGSAGIAASVSKGESPSRQIWLFDSWEGLPDAGILDVAVDGQRGMAGWARGSRAMVEELLFAKLKAAPGRIHLVQGWFEDTLSPTKQSMGGISYLLIDCDWYDSTRLVLRELYEQIIPGGFVMVDDYAYWGGVKQAVDEFFDEQELRPTLVSVPPVAVWFRKPAGAPFDDRTTT